MEAVDQWNLKVRGSLFQLTLEQLHNLAKFLKVAIVIKLSSNIWGKIEYKKLINLDDPQCQNLEVHLTMYESQSDVKYKYCPDDSRVFRAYWVIMGIQLSIQEDDAYILS